ncbi:MAG: FxsA family protein [Emcibacter sp.]|nr:FxsA family protein [Emcibacter sp.]
MPFLILIILLAVPYLEFLVFLEVGEAIGGFQALMLTIATAFIGIYLIRQQGLVVLNRMHETLQRGESPVENILHGFFLLIAGLFFLLPGFITDSVALFLTIPPFRTILGKLILNNINDIFYKKSQKTNHYNSPHEGIIIEGDYKEDPDNQKNINHKK